MDIPAICQSCGAVVRSGITVGVGSQVSTEGCLSSCSRCGALALVIDGFFEVLDRGIRLFSGPEFTVDVLHALQIAVDDVRSGRATPHQAAAKVRRKNPRAARELREWLNTGISFAALMLAIAIAYGDWKSKDRSNHSDKQVIEEAIEKYLDDYLSYPRQPWDNYYIDKRAERPSQHKT